MSQKLQILISLFFLLSFVVCEVTMNRTDADGNANVLTFKAPTADTSKALRMEAHLTTNVSLTQNSKFYAYCAAHDSGTDVTTLTDPPVFEIEQRWMEAGTCDNGGSGFILVTVKGGKYFFPLDH